MRAGSRWKRFQSRLRYWLNRSERPRLLWEEMGFHIESITQELAAQGMSEPDARAAAHRKWFHHGGSWCCCWPDSRLSP